LTSQVIPTTTAAAAAIRARPRRLQTTGRAKRRPGDEHRDRDQRELEQRARHVEVPGAAGDDVARPLPLLEDEGEGVIEPEVDDRQRQRPCQQQAEAGGASSRPRSSGGDDGGLIERQLPAASSPTVSSTGRWPRKCEA